MTEIGFYHLTTSPLERALPKLLEKVLERGFRVLIMAGNDEQVDQLNELLWTYDPDSFLPHGSLRDGNEALQPILLSAEDSNPNDANVLVVLNGQQPTSLSSYERVIDMFNGNHEASVQSARSRWKQQKDAGHLLTYWKQDENGGWIKAA